MKERKSVWLAVFVAVALVTAGGQIALADDAPPDAKITNAVDDELAEDQATPADSIDISTTEGIVTLTGSVDNILGKDRAEQLAASVKGVRAVVNRIKVNAPFRTDAEIRDDVRDALLWDPVTEAWALKVSVTGGVVALSGSVDSWQERDLAGKIAKGVSGVRDLENKVTIDFESDRSDFEIQEEIEAALHWDTFVDDALIDVSVEDGDVTLNGIVGSLAEKNRAYAKAWVAGAKSVDDGELEVAHWARDERLRKNKYVAKSDQEIGGAVRDALLYDPRVFSFKIVVEPDSGYVTLRGNVDNLKAKRAAAQDARSVVGVWGVDNKIKVRPEDKLSDRRIQTAVSSALLRDPYVDRYEVDVSVVNGHVYLYGDVTSTFEKARADDVAGRQMGVVDVHSFLTAYDAGVETYRPYVDAWYIYDYDWYSPPDQPATEPDWQIEREIESELFWSPFVDADEVTVEVEGGIATLTGTVDTWSEREAAGENAIEGGAVLVANDLVVEYGPDDIQ